MPTCQAPPPPSQAQAENVDLKAFWNAKAPNKLDKKGLTPHFPGSDLSDQAVWSRSIAAKLRESGRCKEAQGLEACCQTASFCHCIGCGAVHVWPNHCDKFYCPQCTWRISAKRRQALTAWSKEVPHPIHMVLTVRNRATISKTYVKWFQVCQTRLRRSKFAKQWKGGLTALEVTNEGQGWHLHSHSLVDTTYIDGPTLARQWAKTVGQDVAIIKCKAVDGPTYLHEVTKYAVKGSQAATWSGEDIAAWIDSFTGVRAFSCWGNLFKDRARKAKILALLQREPWECPKCGSSDFHVLDQNEHDYFEATNHWPWERA